MNKLLLTTALLFPLGAMAMTCDHERPAHAAKTSESMTHMHHGAPHMKMRVQTDTSPQTKEAMAANMKMHHAMDIKFTGDADIDFLKGMIAHHQGAVDMAQVQLKYGEDSRVKRMSREIIRAQNLEIKWMKNWLKSLEAKKAGYQDSNWMGEHTSNMYE